MTSHGGYHLSPPVKTCSIMHCSTSRETDCTSSKSSAAMPHASTAEPCRHPPPPPPLQRHRWASSACHHLAQPPNQTLLTQINVGCGCACLCFDLVCFWCLRCFILFSSVFPQKRLDLRVEINNSRGRPVGPLILLPKKAQLRFKTTSSSTTLKVEVFQKAEKRLNFAPKRPLRAQRKK